MLPVPFVGGNSHTVVILFCGLVCIDLRLVKQQAQLLHGILTAALRGCAESLLPAQTDRLCQQRYLLFKGRNPFFLPLKLLIFCTGNGDHFLAACYLFLIISHSPIIPYFTRKVQLWGTVCSHLFHAEPFHRTMRLWLFHTQSLHEPPVLLCTQFPRLRAVSRPLEAPTLQTLVQQNKAVSLPVQPLNPVPPSAAEQKQRIAEWVQLKLLLYQAGQSVYSSPQIRVTAGDVHMIRSLEICQHSFSAWMMARTVSASAPACISIRSAPFSMLATIPLPAGLAEISVKHTSGSAVTV